MFPIKDNLSSIFFENLEFYRLQFDNKLCETMFLLPFLRKPVQNWNICPIFIQIYLIPPEIFGNRTWILICQWIILFFISRHYKIKTLEITWNESNHLSNAEKWYKVYQAKRNIFCENLTCGLLWQTDELHHSRKIIHSWKWYWKYFTTIKHQIIHNI